MKSTDCKSALSGSSFSLPSNKYWLLKTKTAKQNVLRWIKSWILNNLYSVIEQREKLLFTCKIR